MRGPRAGAALTEFALLMPLLLALSLGGIQLSLMAQARIVVQAAAVAAARAAIADPRGLKLSPERAAAVACAGIAGLILPAGLKAGPWEKLPGPPGLSRLLRRGPASKMKTRAAVILRPKENEAEATVEHDLELVVPGVNRLFIYLEKGWLLLPGRRDGLLRNHEARVRTAIYGSPHVLVSATARMPAPWLNARGIRPGLWPAPKLKRKA